MKGARDEDVRPPRGGAGSADEPASLLLHHARRLRDPAGREAAHRFVFDTYYDRLRAFFRRWGIDPEESRELTQDTFVRVLKGRGEFSTEEELDAWIFRIAANVYKNHLRKINAQKRQGAEQPLEEWMEPRGPVIPGAATQAPEDPLDAVLHRERRERLARELVDLPAQMRRCLLLRLFHGWQYREIAEHLGVTLGTVKSHLHQGKARILERMAPDGGRGGPPDENETGP